VLLDSPDVEGTSNKVLRQKGTNVIQGWPWAVWGRWEIDSFIGYPKEESIKLANHSDKEKAKREVPSVNMAIMN
jgi:hypothetical protein